MHPRQNGDGRSTSAVPFPRTPEDVPTILQQVREGADVLPEKQIARRASVDPKAHQ